MLHTRSQDLWDGEMTQVGRNVGRRETITPRSLHFYVPNDPGSRVTSDHPLPERLTER